MDFWCMEYFQKKDAKKEINLSHKINSIFKPLSIIERILADKEKGIKLPDWFEILDNSLSDKNILLSIKNNASIIKRVLESGPFKKQIKIKDNYELNDFDKKIVLQILKDAIDKKITSRILNKAKQIQDYLDEVIKAIQPKKKIIQIIKQ
ncbi:hypothetical protein [Candidatus Phytoplasma australiense]|nr:hypothetical protein [Candidatus Phytoplasma australiense]